MIFSETPFSDLPISTSSGMEKKFNGEVFAVTLSLQIGVNIILQIT